MYINWSSMYSFDASSMIHAWDNYPPENAHFNSFWNWFADQVQNQQFVISQPALDEVSHKIPECGKWLKDKDKGIKIYHLTPDILKTAKKIKQLLSIVEEKYTKGVDENDLLIIATAQEIEATLITEEGVQNKLPELKSNYKIPAVCKMKEVDVHCCRFLYLLKKRKIHENHQLYHLPLRTKSNCPT